MSPKTFIIAAAALAASSAAALPAFAASDSAAPTPPAHPVPLRAAIMFNLIDTNGDGAIDATEATALEKAIFNALDTNKDGKLTPDEFRKIAGGFMGGPGGPEGRQGFMGRGPGFHHWRPGPNWRQGPDGPGGPGGPQQGQLDEQPGPGGPQMGMNDDAGGQQDDAGQQPQNFASLDKNGDGVITPDEFAAGMPGIPGLPMAK